MLEDSDKGEDRSLLYKQYYHYYIYRIYIEAWDALKVLKERRKRI
jgi:hypothetical protein